MYLLKRKHSKYGAQKTFSEGISFSSKLEAGVYQLLRKLEIEGKIIITELQGKVVLTEAKIVYRPDFKIKFLCDETEAFVEAKGAETDTWKLKLKLYRHYGTLPLLIYKGTHLKPKLVEKVIPKEK